MGKAVPEQHPAVVLRSHYVHLRALLVAALIAVLGLTATVVIVANDSDEAAVTSTPAPATIEAAPGATGGAQSAPLPQRKLDGVVDNMQVPRYDGGPEEGSADIIPGVNTPARPTQAQAFPGQAQQADQIGSIQPGAARYDGGPNEGSADVTMSPPIGASSVLSQAGPYRYDGGPNEGSADIQFRGSKASAVNPQTDTRYDGGPNEGSADVTADKGGKASVMPQSDGFRFDGN